MVQSLLWLFGGRSAQKRSKRKANARKPRFRPEVEPLEQRTVPADFTWHGTADVAWGDDWNDSRNWRWSDPGLPNRPPNSSEEVSILASSQVREPVVKSADANCRRITIGGFTAGSHSITINDGFKLIAHGSTTASLTAFWSSQYWGIHGEGTIVVKNQQFVWLKGNIGVKNFYFAGNKTMYIYGNKEIPWTWYSDYIHIGKDENGNETHGGKLQLGLGGGANDLNSNISLDTSDLTIYYGNQLERFSSQCTQSPHF